MRMLQKGTINGYQVEFDRAETVRWYSQAEEWGCECGHCRYFLAAAKRKALPAIIINRLEEFRIPPEKATYVGELYTDDDGVHYQISYRIAGRILAVPDETEEREKAVRCCHEPYPYGAPQFPEPHFDLEFYVTLPNHAPKEQTGGND